MSALEHVQTQLSRAALPAPPSSGAPGGSKNTLAARDEAAAAARRRRDDVAQDVRRRRPTPRARKALRDAQLLFRAAVAKSTTGQQRLMM